MKGQSTQSVQRTLGVAGGPKDLWVETLKMQRGSLGAKLTETVASEG